MVGGIGVIQPFSDKHTIVIQCHCASSTSMDRVGWKTRSPLLAIPHLDSRG